MSAIPAQTIAAEIDRPETKMGDIKARAKAIKKDHDLALALWATGKLNSRLLATLILDKMLLTQESIEDLAADLDSHDDTERNQLADWLLANQLTKSKKTLAMLNSWQEHPLPILRRLFWYHQARLRWTGQTPPDNSDELLTAIEKHLIKEAPEVQWAMNFCAGQIGVHEPRYRARCIKLGEDSGLYKDDVVARNCTPSYLPEFIRIEVAKRA